MAATRTAAARRRQVSIITWSSLWTRMPWKISWPRRNRSGGTGRPPCPASNKGTAQAAALYGAAGSSGQVIGTTFALIGGGKLRVVFFLGGANARDRRHPGVARTRGRRLPGGGGHAAHSPGTLGARRVDRPKWCRSPYGGSMLPAGRGAPRHRDAQDARRRGRPAAPAAPGLRRRVNRRDHGDGS